MYIYIYTVNNKTNKLIQWWYIFRYTWNMFVLGGQSTTHMIVPPNVKSHLWDRKQTTKTGWWLQPLWKILVNWDDSSQYMEKCKKYKMFRITSQIPCFVMDHLVDWYDGSGWVSSFPVWDTKLGTGIGIQDHRGANLHMRELMNKSRDVDFRSLCHILAWGQFSACLKAVDLNCTQTLKFAQIQLG